MRPYERIRATQANVRDVDRSTPRPLSGRAVFVALVGFFGIVIGVNVLMTAFAIGTMPGLENEKPYQAGIGYNTDIEAAREQSARHWTVASHVARNADGHASVEVEARDRDGVPVGGLTVSVKLKRPTDQRADQTISLGERKAGTYLGDAADVAPGVWEIELDASRGPERLFRSRNRVVLE
jgi:nitrogen fixation protein FixH